MHNKKKYIVSSFYNFVYLEQPEVVYNLLKKKLENFNIKGTFIIGIEGINASFSIIYDQDEKVKNIIKKLFPCEVIIKSQENNFHPFLRLKIKLKKEIISLGEKNINPAKNRGKYLDPHSWEKFITKKDSVIIDTRNSYESEIGTFESSLKVNTKNFREFPKWIKKNKDKIKDKKIGMFCTGGIRCEKASNYLIKLGFKNIFQLNGGILEYLKITKNRNQFWKGECFVFDERVSVNSKLEKGRYSQCFACRSAITDKERTSKFFKIGEYCPKCFKIKTLKQKKRYKERQKQMVIAKQKGIKHLGN